MNRLGDGVDGKAPTLGGGELSEDEFTTGPRGTLFLGQRPARHELTLVYSPAVQPISGGSGSLDPSGGEGPGGSGGESPGDGPGTGDGPGGDGGDG